jgi:hypothetical protein
MNREYESFTPEIKRGIKGAPAVRVMPHPSFEPTLLKKGVTILGSKR